MLFLVNFEPKKKKLSILPLATKKLKVNIIIHSIRFVFDGFKGLSLLPLLFRLPLLSLLPLLSNLASPNFPLKIKG